MLGDFMMSDLSRFVKAQEQAYSTALSEIKAGRKYSHWIWYIFPQIAGLGMSSTAQYYSIRDIEEAEDYLDDPYLCGNLIEISEALLNLECSDPTYVLGYPDDLKVRSSMTLFKVAGKGRYPVFQQVLDKYYGGRDDERTLELI
jgi:Uncharacterized conserved protein